MNWRRLVIDLMDREGVSFSEAARMVGRRGGQVAASHRKTKNFRAVVVEREVQRQERMGLR